jgi:energy-coupling factor transporter ATP-binding protein EcfA2
VTTTVERPEHDAPSGGKVPLVELKNVGKAYGNITALKDISLRVHAGEVTGILGDNGAGKSTLIKVLTGVLPPTSGRIFVRDRELNLADYSVRMAPDLSIETVYQDKSLAEKQPLWRNFFVGRQITNRFGFIDIRREKEIADQILKHAIGSVASASRSIPPSPTFPAASGKASPSVGQCTTRPISSCSTSPPPRLLSPKCGRSLISCGASRHRAAPASTLSTASPMYTKWPIGL